MYAEIRIPCYIIFDANGGSGTMPPIMIHNSYTQLPECEFTPKEGLSFAGWSVDSDAEYNEYKGIGEVYTYGVTENITYYAIWNYFYVTWLSAYCEYNGFSGQKIGEEVKYNASIEPWYATLKEVEWSSEDESIATVDKDGVVKGISEGTTKIKARLKGDEEQETSFDVTVKDYPFTRQMESYNEYNSYSSVALSRDGSYAYVSSTNFGLKCSTDKGKTWTSCSDITFDRVVCSDDGSVVAGYSYNDYIYISTDYGATFKKITSRSRQPWSGLALSGDGNTIAVCYRDGYISTSSDGGSKWTTHMRMNGSRDWTDITVSTDGQIITATTEGGEIYQSRDGGTTTTIDESGTGSGWKRFFPRDTTNINAYNIYWLSVSDDGRYIYLGSYGCDYYPVYDATVDDEVYYSHYSCFTKDGGETWQGMGPFTYAEANNCYGPVVCSSNGHVATIGTLLTENSGTSWESGFGFQNRPYYYDYGNYFPHSLAISKDGTFVMYVDDGRSFVYTYDFLETH